MLFDAEIHLKASFCVKAFQQVDLSKGTFLPHYKSYNLIGKEEILYPVVNFDPVQIYVNELRQAYGELAYFFYDIHGDTKVKVLWRRDILKQKEVDTKNLKFFIKDQIKNTYDLNLEFILSDFKLIGKELVEKVEIKKSCSIFQ